MSMMSFVPHANKKVVKKAEVVWGAANDYKEGIQQRNKQGTTAPDIADRALNYVEEVTRQLRPLEEKAKKKSSLNALGEGISQSKREFHQKSDEEMERRKREAREAREPEQGLISRPLMSHGDIQKWIAQDKLRKKGKSNSTSHSSCLPLPPGRTKQYTTSAATRTSTEYRRTPSIDVESVSQASSDRVSIHSRNTGTGESNAPSLKHAPYDDNAWKPGHVRQHTEAFGPDSSRSGYGHSQANLGRVASSSSSRRDSHGRHVSQSSSSHHITSGNQAHAGPSNYQQGYSIQTTSSLTPQARVPHSEHSEEDTDDDSSEEPFGHSYPSSTTLPRHEISHDINALIIVC
ncbi:hypothetical protein JB92DRAFT_3102141 [Gautieria morchelliformis]|nr:hypothetical protein JB92DRAFT_3102141 [Gautieria morchelliformis]